MKHQIKNFCVNCSSPTPGQQENSILHEFTIDLSSQFEAPIENQNKIVKVKDALKEIYNVKLIDDLKCVQQSNFKASNFNCDSENVGVCCSCGNALRRLYKSYQEFNQLRKLDSLLENKIKELQSSESKLNSRLPSSTLSWSQKNRPVRPVCSQLERNEGPWVVLERISPQDIRKLTLRSSHRDQDQDKHFNNSFCHPSSNSDLNQDVVTNYDDPTDNAESETHYPTGVPSDHNYMMENEMSVPEADIEIEIQLDHPPANHGDNIGSTISQNSEPQQQQPIEIQATALAPATVIPNPNSPVINLPVFQLVQVQNVTVNNSNFLTNQTEISNGHKSKVSSDASQDEDDYEVEVVNLMSDDDLDDPNYVSQPSPSPSVCDSPAQPVRPKRTYVHGSSKSNSNLCSTCGKIFTKKDSLRSHERSHWVYQCDNKPYCNRKFPTVEQLNQHLPICRTKDRTPKVDDRTIIYICSQCGKSFPKKDSLRSHERMHWQFQCPNRPQCRRLFENKEAVDKHLESSSCRGVSQPFPCPSCDKAFGYKFQLDLHIVCHTKESSFICPYCGKNFTRKSSFIVHERRHLKIKRFECSKCPMKFVTKHQLDVHLTKHFDVKAFDCSLCEKQFKTKELLKLHQVKHKKDKAFTCSSCKKKFHRKVQLTRHKCVPKEQDEPSYNCTQCDKLFSDERTLLRHILSHRKKKIYKCQFCTSTFTDSRILKTHLLTHAEDDDEEDEECDEVDWEEEEYDDDDD